MIETDRHRQTVIQTEDIKKEREGEREKERKRDREKERKRERETERKSYYPPQSMTTPKMT